MYRQSIPLTGSFAAWRNAARSFVALGVEPQLISWSEEGAESGLFGEALTADPPAARIMVPGAFVDSAQRAICHRDPQRFALLYDMLWRLQRQPSLLEDESDALVSAIRQLTKAVSRDCHKMKAFVRFREDEANADAPRRRFVAWFEPDHNITELTAPFFASRFADMDWIIATPLVTAIFESGELSFAPTSERPPALPDPTIGLWQTYYASIFNPARLKVKAMKAEMPAKYWKNLPEAALIPELVAHAAERAAGMREAAPTEPSRRIPARGISEPHPPEEDAATLEQLAALTASCRRCPLYRNATQAVFGEGHSQAGLMLVGEQPGDREDLDGRPFVGPAGQLLDRALKEAGILRAETYLTNAVKHFKCEPRGKVRLHKSPDRHEVEHCRWWLRKEIELVRPRLIVALGGTAALSLTGVSAGVLRRRGVLERPEGLPPVFITVHPSSILRTPDRSASAQAYDDFVRDLVAAKSALAALG